MKKLLLIILLTISGTISARNFDYVYDARNVFECFSSVDFNEYSPSRRNMGFDICQKGFDGMISPLHCSTLADRYYGNAAKNIAMNKCLENAPSFGLCLQIADNLPAVPARHRAALGCLESFISEITKEDCLRVGWKYKPLENRVNVLCEEYFPSEE
ncbi:hypothetical protein [Bacteriovorax sp. Seq25_V]|uniref:hypothetical protein n=1 Tax=Bacteriovorax sp. Seq25_V TaxID=1201288 RepID=UPI000389FB4E|nr:hypothetical protein [Bacteriovorax sp. Seq25_V]EQC47583.1 hypothetical protein M900_0844 [Bacteriovorax sp. Seq25_V]